MKPNNCVEDHRENMKRLIASEAKQGEVVKNCAMRALVSTPRHFDHGGEIGVARQLVKSK
jgi:hypothetical protein